MEQAEDSNEQSASEQAEASNEHSVSEQAEASNEHSVSEQADRASELSCSEQLDGSSDHSPPERSDASARVTPKQVDSSNDHSPPERPDASDRVNPEQVDGSGDTSPPEEAFASERITPKHVDRLSDHLLPERADASKCVTPEQVEGSADHAPPERPNASERVTSELVEVSGDTSPPEPADASKRVSPEQVYGSGDHLSSEQADVSERTSDQGEGSSDVAPEEAEPEKAASEQAASRDPVVPTICFEDSEDVAKWFSEERLELFSEMFELTPSLWRTVHAGKVKEKSARGFAYMRLLKGLGETAAMFRLPRAMALCREFLRALRQEMRSAAMKAIAKQEGAAAALRSCPRWVVRAEGYMKLFPPLYKRCLLTKDKRSSAGPASSKSNSEKRPKSPGFVIPPELRAPGGAAGERLMRRVVRGVRRAAPRRGLSRAAAAHAAKRIGNPVEHVYALWCSMRALAMYKLRAQVARGDAPGRGDARMTVIDWAVADLLLYYDCALLNEQTSYQQYEQLRALLGTFHLVQRCGLEPERSGHRVPPRKWHDAVRTCTDAQISSMSAVALQRRWHELKMDTRRCARAQLRSAQAPALLPLQQAIARRYPHVVTDALTPWRRLAAAGLLAKPTSERGPAPGEITRLERSPDSSASDSENAGEEDDLILVEKNIETIDLSEDESGSSQGRSQRGSKDMPDLGDISDVELDLSQNKDGNNTGEPSKNKKTKPTRKPSKKKSVEENIDVNKEVDAHALSPPSDVLEAFQNLDVSNVETTIVFDSDEENNLLMIYEDVPKSVSQHSRNVEALNKASDTNAQNLDSQKKGGKKLRKPKPKPRRQIIESSDSDSDCGQLVIDDDNDEDFNVNDCSNSEESGSELGNLVIDDEDQDENIDGRNTGRRSNTTQAGHTSDHNEDMFRAIEREMFDPNKSKINACIVGTNFTQNLEQSHVDNQDSRSHDGRSSPSFDEMNARRSSSDAQNKSHPLLSQMLQTKSLFKEHFSESKNMKVYSNKSWKVNVTKSTSGQDNNKLLSLIGKKREKVSVKSLVQKFKKNNGSHIVIQDSDSADEELSRLNSEPGDSGDEEFAESGIDPQLLMYPVVVLTRIDDERSPRAPPRRSLSHQRSPSPRGPPSSRGLPSPHGSPNSSRTSSPPLKPNLSFPLFTTQLTSDFVSIERNLALMQRCKRCAVVLSPLDAAGVEGWRGGGSRVAKKVELPDIEEVRRNNRSMLTAQVAPIQSKSSSPEVESASGTPSTEDVQRLLDRLSGFPATVGCCARERASNGEPASRTRGCEKCCAWLLARPPTSAREARQQRGLLRHAARLALTTHTIKNTPIEPQPKEISKKQKKKNKPHYTPTPPTPARPPSPPSPVDPEASAREWQRQKNIAAEKFGVKPRCLKRKAVETPKDTPKDPNNEPAMVVKDAACPPWARPNVNHSPENRPVQTAPKQAADIFNASAVADFNRKLGMLAENHPEPMEPTGQFLPVISNVHSLARQNTEPEKPPDLPTITLKRAEPVYASYLNNINKDPNLQQQKFILIPSQMQQNFQPQVQNQPTIIQQQNQNMPQVVDVAGGINLAASQDSDKTGLHLVVHQGVYLTRSDVGNPYINPSSLPNQPQNFPNQNTLPISSVQSGPPQSLLNMQHEPLAISMSSGVSLSTANSMLVTPMTTGNAQANWIFSSMPGGPTQPVQMVVRSVQAGPSADTADRNLQSAGNNLNQQELMAVGRSLLMQESVAVGRNVPQQERPAELTPTIQHTAPATTPKKSDDESKCPEVELSLDWDAAAVPSKLWVEGRDPTTLNVLCVARGGSWVLGGRFLLLSDGEPPPARAAAWALWPRLRLQLPGEDFEPPSKLRKIAPKPDNPVPLETPRDGATKPPWLKVKSFARIDYDEAAEAAEAKEPEPPSADKLAVAPPRVFLDDKVYQKLSDQPLTYAKPKEDVSRITLSGDEEVTDALVALAHALYKLPEPEPEPEPKAEPEPKPKSKSKPADAQRPTAAGKERVSGALMEARQRVLQAALSGPWLPAPRLKMASALRPAAPAPPAPPTPPAPRHKMVSALRATAPAPPTPRFNMASTLRPAAPPPRPPAPPKPPKPPALKPKPIRPQSSNIEKILTTGTQTKLPTIRPKPIPKSRPPPKPAYKRAATDGARPHPPAPAAAPRLLNPAAGAARHQDEPSPAALQVVSSQQHRQKTYRLVLPGPAGPGGTTDTTDTTGTMSTSGTVTIAGKLLDSVVVVPASKRPGVIELSSDED